MMENKAYIICCHYDNGELWEDHCERCYVGSIYPDVETARLGLNSWVCEFSKRKELNLFEKKSLMETYNDEFGGQYEFSIRPIKVGETRQVEGFEL